MDNIIVWMNTNRLLMNISKMEFILYGSSKQIYRCHTTSHRVIFDTIPQSKCVKYSCAWMDENITLKQHIAIKCKVAKYNLLMLKHIR